MPKLKFPEQYVLYGEFRLHSGQKSTFKYDVEEAMKNTLLTIYPLAGIILELRLEEGKWLKLHIKEIQNQNFHTYPKTKN